MTRLLRTTDRSHLIIEVGAGYNPVAPKFDGWRTHVVDHDSRDNLRRKYATAAVDINQIEEVDTIWTSGPLHEAVPATLLGKVDTIIASHVLEHFPDLIGFLQSASRLVRPGGCLSVALPDRRYCFDCFKSWTTTGDLLDAWQRGLSRHSLKTVYNHMAYSATMDGQIAWGPRPIDAPALQESFQAAADTVASFQKSGDGPYQDFHASQFTPAGFELVMLELRAMGLTDWRVETLEGPENFEFFVSLRQTKGLADASADLRMRRQALLLRQLTETREQIDFILPPVARSEPTAGQPDTTYQDLLDKLAEQDSRMQEMAETLRWLRAMLTPVRSIWRKVRRPPE
ncbi:class I SAM-dependent methyltransferase [Rhodopila sp.]|uniref:class I SAM-dependent methyltransferase n=1 Tax=Rhodopila sp. TaxID=2480087 RepID=UPI003D098812